MQNREINTGSKSLDKGIALLFDWHENNKYTNINNIILKKGISKEEIIKIMPNTLLYLCYALVDDEMYNTILEKSNKDSHSLIEEARNIVLSDYNKLIEHPVFQDIITDIESGQDDEIDPQITKFNIPESITFIPILNGYPPTLRPAVRLALIDGNDEVILDTMLQWDDMSFLISGFLGVLEEQLREYQTLANNNQIEITSDKKKRIRDNLNKASGRLKIINDHLKIYKI